MQKLSHWISPRTVSWIQLAVSFLLVVWALAVYPFAFEIAGRMQTAHAASDSEVGVIAWEMEKMGASGWFTISLTLAFCLAFFSMIWIREDRRVGFVQRIAMLGPVALLVLHVFVDGPGFVAISVIFTAMVPFTFFDPIDLCLQGVGLR